MKLKLNKKKIKNLSRDMKTLPENLTPQIGGAMENPSDQCSINCSINNCWTDTCWTNTCQITQYCNKTDLC
ncbi:hypothetical protein [Pseudoalteromonas denitrificans]|jgi:hypothetical protein|uniref:Uncharacterized protein n=1 Tax=Pseudoalteromonas denitrificans DSM 6059 TaxID=1123010 RepID=A0A1I1QZ52_9GAMM|nr:hypothetical protein [Pseudoalteromonas denitrificans]SFD27404.1 hypothetical protein SAMN02745724_04060 [Pseudoalteromonas denitrificans DSM 6059]